MKQVNQIGKYTKKDDVLVAKAGTLSFWNGKWRVSYTTENGDFRGDSGLELHPTQVEDINIFTHYIKKRGGVDVIYNVVDGFAKLNDTNVTHYKIVKGATANEYGWRQTYFVIGEYTNDRIVIIPKNRFNEWEKTNLNKKMGFNKYEEIVSKTEVI